MQQLINQLKNRTIVALMFTLEIILCSGLISEAQVPTGSVCVTPLSGAVAWYPADGNAKDIVAGHNGVLAWLNRVDGQLYPADGQHGPTFASGLVGQAFSFDGADSLVKASDDPAGAFGSAPFTVALWAKFDSNFNFDLPRGGAGFISSDGD